MPLPTINTQDIVDKIAQRNWLNLKAFLRLNTQLLEFKFYEVTFTGAVSASKYPHNLGITPKDIIQTSITGTGAVTFNYASFDATNFVITTTGPCVVRFFAGTYQSGAS